MAILRMPNRFGFVSIGEHMTQDDENMWKGFRRLSPHPLIEFGALIIITGMYLYNAFSYELPVG